MFARIACVLALIVAGSVSLGWAGPKVSAGAGGKEAPVTALKIVVTGGDKGVIVDNASVYVRYTEPRFLRHPSKIELDLKTDLKGIATVRDVPRIKVMIQVVKAGWQPFGEYYVLDKDEETIKIKLKPPPHWY
ncbi:MAG: hypothetical protein ACYC92_07795 [Candidatus Acidiferrales bacterium]